MASEKQSARTSHSRHDDDRTAERAAHSHPRHRLDGPHQSRVLVFHFIIFNSLNVASLFYSLKIKGGESASGQSCTTSALQWDDNNDALRSSARRRMVPVSVGIRIGVVSRSRARFLPSLQTRLPDEQRLDRLGRRSGPLPMLGTIRGLRSRNRPLHRLPREHGRRPLPIVRCRILRRSISGGWMQAPT